MLDNYTIFYSLLCGFFAITFLESGLDKLIHRSGNLSWFQSQFEKTFLRSIIAPLFYCITLQELAVGSLMLFAIGEIWAGGTSFMEVGGLLSLFLLLQLFIGQRIAKEYVGAAGIVPYIIVAILIVIVSRFDL